MAQQLLVRIPDNLHRAVKAKAALEGRSIKCVVSELLEGYLNIPVKDCLAWSAPQSDYTPDMASRNG